MYRLLPPEIAKRFALCDVSPSGLKYAEATYKHAVGDPAGSLDSSGRYYTVPFQGSMWGAHRVIMYLRGELDHTKTVHHTKSLDNHAPLVCMTQAENLSQEKGKPKKGPQGYSRTKLQIKHKGKLYSLHQFCITYKLPYHKVRIRILKELGYTKIPVTLRTILESEHILGLVKTEPV